MAPDQLRHVPPSKSRSLASLVRVDLASIHRRHRVERQQFVSPDLSAGLRRRNGLSVHIKHLQRHRRVELQRLLDSEQAFDRSSQTHRASSSPSLYPQNSTRSRAVALVVLFVDGIDTDTPKKTDRSKRGILHSIPPQPTKNVFRFYQLQGAPCHC